MAYEKQNFEDGQILMAEFLNHMEGGIEDAQNMAEQAINLAMSGGAKVQTVSYVGTGTYGEENPCSLTFDFEPNLVMMIGEKTQTSASSESSLGIIACVVLTTAYQSGTGFYNSLWTGSRYAKKSADGKTIFWYHSKSESAQYNSSNTEYYVIALG